MISLNKYYDPNKNYSESPSKPILKGFDENSNLLYHANGVYGGGVYSDNCIFYCSKCLKRYFILNPLKKHALNCKRVFDDGINKIKKYPQKIVENFINQFSSMSKIVQGIDFNMSNESAIRLGDKTVLVLIENQKPVGYITYCIKKGENREYFSIEDFFVMEYQRKKGYGNKLFIQLLKDLNIEDSKQLIEEKIIICSPSVDFCKFLLKRELDTINIW